jgi:hypothetical protein
VTVPAAWETGSIVPRRATISEGFAFGYMERFLSGKRCGPGAHCGAPDAQISGPRG